MAEIETENQFIWKLIWHTILTPITIILVLLKKKEPKDILQPLIDIVKFVTEPKVTVTLLLANTGFTLFAWNFVSEQTFSSLMLHTSDLLNPARYYTLFTSAFLHADALHLISNMIALFIFGRVVERKLGSLKTIGVYLMALLVSSIGTQVTHFIAGSNIALLGASGAIMGLLGAAILIDPFYITYELGIPMPVMIAGWLVIYANLTGILFPVDDGIAHVAHLLGLKSVSTTLYLFGEKEELKKGFVINLVSLVIAGIIYLLMFVGLVPEFHKEIEMRISGFVG